MFRAPPEKIGCTYPHIHVLPRFDDSSQPFSQVIISGHVLIVEGKLGGTLSYIVAVALALFLS